MTSREQFEAWAPNYCWKYSTTKELAWLAWQASRNALEIKLPPAINTEEIGVAISKERTMARLAFAGIKVKGE